MTKKTPATRKTSVKKRTLNSGGKKPPVGVPFQEQDPKRRLGNFSGAGEHPLKGGRTAGIVGMSKQRNHTDKNS